MVHPIRRVFRRISILGGAGAVACGLGLAVPSTGHAQKVTTTPPAAPGAGGGTPAVLPASVTSSPDYSSRVVGYIYDNIPITREELGEYLIALSLIHI